VLLLDIHSKLLTQFDCKEVCASSPSQVNAGAGPRPRSQDGVSHQEETTTLILPELNRLIETSFGWDERSASNADTTDIPAQDRVTQQILNHWQPLQDLKLMCPSSRWTEQLSLRSHHRVLVTVEESVLKTEMGDLESQEEDTPKRLLFYKSMSWLVGL
jgi:hypothetical protein